MKLNFLINSAVILSMILVALRMFTAQNYYEKIVSFYLLFTYFILLVLGTSNIKFIQILDLILVLFLLKILAVLFLIFNRKKT